MKILCLHGSYGSASNFRDQLSPLIDVVGRSGAVNFTFINGQYETAPPEGFEDYFGSPPLYRFSEFDGVSSFEDMLGRIRDIPSALKAKDTMRLLLGDLALMSTPSINTALNRLFQMIEEDPEIEGILGYSEGATIAATLILEERRRLEEQGRLRRIKFGIFFAGWPPVRVSDIKSAECVLVDECQDLIDIPTCHIIGCKDPYIDGAIALYNVCDESTATLFDHGKGHTLPRDKRTIRELSCAMEDIWKRTCIL